MNKRGQGQFGFTSVILGLLILFVLIIGIVTLTNYNSGTGFGSALSTSINSVSDGFLTVLGPVFNSVLGLNREGIDPNNQFLMILTFILISIIIVGTLDSVNLFGDVRQGGLINLFIGIIVSIIGVRFMPTDIWGALTAPSSAFVATILVAAPFAAFFFVTMKLEYPLARKVLWLFYVVFMSYLIFSRVNTFTWIYLIFLVLAAVMLFFDSTVRHYFYAEKHKKEIEDTIGKLSAVERYKIRRQIEDNERIIADTSAPAADVAKAKREIKKLTNAYGDLSRV